jgi:hypothetical protein
MKLTVPIKLLLRSAAELAGVTLLVFVTGWAGVRVAEAAHHHPVRANGAGVVELHIAKSDRRGDVSFEEGSGYAGWWHCRGNDWAVEWRFAAESNRPYRVEVLVATLETIADKKIAVAIHDQASGGDQLLQAAIPASGPGKWRTISFGETSLGTGPFTLTVRPGSADLTNLNVKSATLRPKESS